MQAVKADDRPAAARLMRRVAGRYSRLAEAVAEVDPAAIVPRLTGIDLVGQELLLRGQIGIVDVAEPGLRPAVLAVAPAVAAGLEPVLEIEG
jgi:hypothetical protein